MLIICSSQGVTLHSSPYCHRIAGQLTVSVHALTLELEDRLCQNRPISGHLEVHRPHTVRAEPNTVSQWIFQLYDIPGKTLLILFWVRLFSLGAPFILPWRLLSSSCILDATLRVFGVFSLCSFISSLVLLFPSLVFAVAAGLPAGNVEPPANLPSPSCATCRAHVLQRRKAARALFV